MSYRKIILSIFPIILLAAALFFSTPVSATCPEGQVQTNFFGCVEDDEKGCGVWMTINLVITILTYGVAIAATIGLVITAIMYITAHDNVGQLAKAKTRILEIIIGLGIYAAMWTIASWLIPGGIFNGGNVCNTSAPTAGPSNVIKTQDKKDNDNNNNSNDDTSGLAESIDGTFSGTKSYTKRISDKSFKLDLKGPKGTKLKSKSKKIAIVRKDGTVYPMDVGSTEIVASSGSQKYTIKIKIKKRKSKPKIGEARMGNNTYGDQGSEVGTGSWSGSWTYVFRFKKPERAIFAAKNMKDACNNQHVGYQFPQVNGRRTSFYRELKKAKWESKDIKNDCATCCSQMVLAIVQSSGLHRGGGEGWSDKDAIGAANQLKKCKKSFRKITDEKYTSGYKYLKRGDILIRTTGSNHALMVIN